MKSSSTPDPEPPCDDEWLAGVVGREIADQLWPLIELAEHDRLVRTFGYPKDNVIPPSLRQRLALPHFAECIRRELVDNDAEQQLTDALARLIVVARQP